MTVEITPKATGTVGDRSESVLFGESVIVGPQKRWIGDSPYGERLL